MKWVFLGLALALLLAHPVDVSAQPMQVVSTCGGVTFIVGDGVNGTVDTTGKQCVNATVSVSASIAGFTPSNHYATLTATASSSASTAIPTNTGSVVLYNTGTSAVSCTFASGAAVGVANNEIIQPASSVGYSTTGYDHVACIDQTGSASNLVILSGGAGLFAGASGGGGGSGGGGASSTFGAAFPSVGTAAGMSDGTNMLAVRGDNTNGLWVNIKSAPALAVTGTFFQTTQPVSIANGSDAALGSTTDAPCTVPTTSAACTLEGAVKALTNLANSPLPAQVNTTTNIGNIGQTNGDPCTTVAHVFTPINISTAVNTKIVVGTSAKKTYICHLFLFAAGADNVGLVEGSGTNCATSPLGLIGGATAATGVTLIANQGWSEGSGTNAIAATTVNANDFCAITSASVQLSGVVVTVQQ